MYVYSGIKQRKKKRLQEQIVKDFIFRLKALECYQESEIQLSLEKHHWKVGQMTSSFDGVKTGVI